MPLAIPTKPIQVQKEDGEKEPGEKFHGVISSFILFLSVFTILTYPTTIEAE